MRLTWRLMATGLNALIAVIGIRGFGMCGFKCQAIQQSDQKRCDRCDLTWDMNDLDPPECKTVHASGHAFDGVMIHADDEFNDLPSLDYEFTVVSNNGENKIPCGGIAKSALNKIKELLS